MYEGSCITVPHQDTGLQMVENGRVRFMTPAPKEIFSNWMIPMITYSEITQCWTDGSKIESPLCKVNIGHGNILVILELLLAIFILVVMELWLVTSILVMNDGLAIVSEKEEIRRIQIIFHSRIIQIEAISDTTVSSLKQYLRNYYNIKGNIMMTYRNKPLRDELKLWEDYDYQNNQIINIETLRLCGGMKNGRARGGRKKEDRKEETGLSSYLPSFLSPTKMQRDSSDEVSRDEESDEDYFEEKEVRGKTPILSFNSIISDSDSPTTDRSISSTTNTTTTADNSNITTSNTTTVLSKPKVNKKEISDEGKEADEKDEIIAQLQIRLTQQDEMLEEFGNWKRTLEEKKKKKMREKEDGSNGSLERMMITMCKQQQEMFAIIQDRIYTEDSTIPNTPTTNISSPKSSAKPLPIPLRMRENFDGYGKPTPVKLCYPAKDNHDSKPKLIQTHSSKMNKAQDVPIKKYMKGDNFEEWLRQFNYYRGLGNWNNSTSILTLNKYVDEHIQKILVKYKTEEFSVFEDLVKVLASMEELLPKTEEDYLNEIYHAKMLNKETITEYYWRFTELCARANRPNDEKLKKTYFSKGLKPLSLYKAVQLDIKEKGTDKITFDEIYQKAKNLEDVDQMVVNRKKDDLDNDNINNNASSKCGFCGRKHDFKECKDKYPFYRATEIRKLLEQDKTILERTEWPEDDRPPRRVRALSRDRGNSKDRVVDPSKCLSCQINDPNPNFKYCDDCYKAYVATLPKNGWRGRSSSPKRI